MQFDGALIKEQGISFAVVVVKPNVLDFSTQREEVRKEFARYFPSVPIILMAQNSRGIPTYHGRPDIVDFLASINHSRIPFQRYTVN